MPFTERNSIVVQLDKPRACCPTCKKEIPQRFFATTKLNSQFVRLVHNYRCPGCHHQLRQYDLIRAWQPTAAASDKEPRIIWRRGNPAGFTNGGGNVQ